MAKAVNWTITDAEARKRGEQTGLDLSLIHISNKGLSAFAEELERLTARWRDRLAP